MKIMKIGYIRNFDLNEKNIVKIIKNYGNLDINDNILLNFSDIKKSLSLIEIKSESNVFKFSHPLGDFKKIEVVMQFMWLTKINYIKTSIFQNGKKLSRRI